MFKLADHVKVANATLENGLLAVDLVREIPELKPRRIAIGSAPSASSAETAKKEISQDTSRNAKRPELYYTSDLRLASRALLRGTNCG